MKILLILTGKTRSDEIQKLENEYYQRLRHYVNFETVVIPDLKNTKKLTELQIKAKESELITKQFQPGDHIILLDEKGKEFTSLKFAGHLQSLMNRGLKRIVFVVGGPYGFDENIYQAASEKIALSKMTFSHQIIRAIFAEQLYRAFTILNNEPYHHQ